MENTENTQVQVEQVTTPVEQTSTPVEAKTEVVQDQYPDNPELQEFLNPKVEDVKTESKEITTEQKPEWLPEKFKTPEDLAKSYNKLQAELTKKAQELAETKKKTAEYEQQTQSKEIKSINDSLKEKVQERYQEALDKCLNDYNNGLITEAQKLVEMKRLDSILDADYKRIDSNEIAKEQLGIKEQAQTQEVPIYNEQAIIEKYGEPVKIDDFVATANIQEDYKKEAFNELKSLYGDFLGANELKYVNNLIDKVVLQATNAIENKYKNNADMQKLSSAAGNLNTVSTGEKIYTRAEIDSMPLSEFAKIEKIIDEQMAKGLIK